jgi:hypothetical protein
MSIEPMTSGTERQAPTTCPACGAPIAPDQRYCLECGERQVARSEFLMATAALTPPPAEPPAHVAAPPEDSRRNTLLVLALIALLLVATGLGVLIGKSGKGPVYHPVIINSGSGSAGAASTQSSETASFKGDWPSGKSGFTVQLETLPSSSTTAAVEAAKSAATAKGAANVGALKGEEFSSIGSTEFVIYSGEYGSKADAQKALGALKAKFPAAKVLEVSTKEASEPGESKAEAKESTHEAEAEKAKPPGESIAKPKKAPSSTGSGKNYGKGVGNIVETE